MRALWLFDNKYSSEYDNYKLYEFLVWNWWEDVNLNSNLNSLLLTPINDRIDELKIKYLQSYAENKEYVKSLVINLYNKMLDDWTNIDLNKFKEYFQSWQYNLNIQELFDKYFKIK
jgi:hypothetical protein